MTTTQYNLIELHTFFYSQQITTLSNERTEITLDDKHDITSIQLMIHDDNEYFSFMNNATNFSDSYWLSDNHHKVTLSSASTTTEDATTEDATTEDSSSVDSSGVDYFLSTEDATTEDATTDNLDVSAIADLCSEFSGIQLLELCQKLQTMAVKKIKSENKKTTKKDKPEKTQVTITKKVSDKNFNYFDLLSSWYNSALSAREIAADSELSNGYGAATIAEDMRVIKVLLGGDKLVQISKEWCDYIINYWSENSDTTWVRLHYAFSKDGRKCNDLNILCNYVIDNGVTKEDVKNAIAGQN